MTLGELMAKLEAATREEGVPLTSQVKVRHGSNYGPNHYSLETIVNGNNEVIILCTYRTDDPDRDGPEYRPN